ncbi:MAG: DUF2958 domain-containing protein [Planctomycetota bacterium]|nr:DUF2958 domain-containing protein [Planctomycetota bacterium]
MIENIVHRHMKTAAGKPYLSNMGLTKAKAMAGEAAMLYSIEAGSNKSKYYEMLIVVADDGTAQLIKANGRLGSQPRMGRPEQYRDLDSAKRALAKVKRSKINGRSAYKDAFDSKHHKTPDGKQLPKGQYPVGLATNPGSWRNQDDIQAMKPTLNRLVQKINEAVADADNADMNSVLDDLQAANALAMQLGRSSMADEIKKKIKAPLARLQGGGRHRVDPIKVVREMKSLSRYISKQLSMTMTASIVDRTARLKTQDLRDCPDWIQKAAAVFTKAMNSDDLVRDWGSAYGWNFSKVQLLGNLSRTTPAYMLDFNIYLDTKWWVEENTLNVAITCDEAYGQQLYYFGAGLAAYNQHGRRGPAVQKKLRSPQEVVKLLTNLIKKSTKTLDTKFKPSDGVMEALSPKWVQEDRAPEGFYSKTAIKFPLDGARKHELMPGSLARKIPKLYSQDEVEDPIVYTKFFNPYGRGTWLITEFDGRETMFGYAKITHGELGYISLSELANANRNGLPLIERDLSWRPMPLSKAKGRMASTKTASGSGRANAKYLNSISPSKKSKVLKHIAKWYGVSVREIEEELVHPEAENLFEYAASDRSLAMDILHDFKRMRLLASKQTASTKTARVRERDFALAIEKERRLNYSEETIKNIAYAMSEWNDHRDPQDAEELNDYVDELMDDIRDNTHDGDEKIDLTQDERYLVKAFAKARRIRMASTKIADMPSFQWPLGAMSDEDSANIEAVMQRAVGRDYTVWRKTSVGATTDIVVSSPRMDWEDFAADFKGFLHDKIAKILKRFDKVKRVNVPAVQRLNAKLLAHVRAIKTAKTAKDFSRAKNWKKMPDYGFTSYHMTDKRDDSLFDRMIVTDNGRKDGYILEVIMKDQSKWRSKTFPWDSEHWGKPNKPVFSLANKMLYQQIHPAKANMRQIRGPKRPAFGGAMKSAKGIRWQGSHVIVDTDRMLSIKGVPKDEYGQVYDAALLPDSRNGVRMRKLVLQIVLENKSKIMRMRSPYEVTEFISKQTMALKGKTPNWHHYSMPD